MCNHKYTTDRYGYGTNGDKCPYTQLYRQLQNEKKSELKKIDSRLELPMDNNGICLFHSHDLNWKRENKFTEKFLQLVQLLDDYNPGQYYDFSEFLFVGETTRSKKNSESYAFKLSETVFRKEARFNGAVFTDPMELDKVSFKNGANFSYATFKDSLIIQKCSIGSSNFDRAVFEKNATFKDSYFPGSYTIFTDSVFNNMVKFIDTKFDGMVVFSGAIFNRSKDASFVAKFQHVVFEGSVIFTDSIFCCPAEFRDVTFNLNAEFVDTSFNTSKSTFKYNNADVQFYNIGLNEDGLLIFESTDSQNKMFNETDAILSFEENIKGVLRFKNVNFNNISNASRNRIFELSKAGKVEIGPGCIKYRYQTQTKTIFIGVDNQFLILELTQTFTNYFTAKNGLNLGFEIVSRENDRINFFYFTDEDITEAEFLNRLEKTENDLWNLINLKPGNNHSLPDPEARTNSMPKTTKENVLINTIDGLSALMSTFFRVAIRIAFGKWKEQDTKALVEAINFNNKKPAVRPGYLHQTIINNYSQKVLFGIHNIQEQNLNQ